MERLGEMRKGRRERIGEWEQREDREKKEKETKKGN